MKRWLGSHYIERLLVGIGGVQISAGADVPTHSAKQGSFYIRTGQAINATLYVNTDGDDGWTLANSIQA